MKAEQLEMKMSVPGQKTLWPLLALLLALPLSACGGEEQQEASCIDGIMNGDETDVDCGGSCPGCLDGQSCLVDGDCLSGFCLEGVCTSPTCEDGIMNGDETDVDCGGPDCPPCGAGASCERDEDCASGDCEGGICAAPDTCSDGVLNGDETDVDCGGSCPPCELGKFCETGSDCLSGYCSDAGFCENAPTCDDGILNGEETDVDCGGPDCPPCPENHLCREDSDCSMGVCADGVCDATPENHCDNGVLDGDETDVDCGGSCPPCEPGMRCDEDTDCASGLTFVSCQDGICGGLWTCDDGTRNGHETDVDCGGPFCQPCLEGASCLVDSDCASDDCIDGECTEPEYTCDNEVMDGHETDVDCGGPVCGPCQDGFACTFGSDCESWSCQDGICGGMAVCEDGVQNGHETDVDCGGPLCPPCRAGKSCLEDLDCGSGACSEGTCAFAPTCGDGEQNDDETDVDCGGPGCVPCEVGKSCLVHADCETGYCNDGTCAYSVQSLQSGDASVACDDSVRTTVLEEITVSPVVVISEAFEIDEDTDGYYVAFDPLFSHEPEYSGILVAVDRSLGLSFAPGDAASVTGDYVEDHCTSTLSVGPEGDMVHVSDLLFTPSPHPANAELFEQGGSPSAQPYEGVRVSIEGEVTDTGGYDGPEGPGQPHWWFKFGNDIYVANDFGLTEQPEVGTTVVVSGVVKYSHGLYLLVPLDEDSVWEPGGWEPLP